MFYRPVRWNYFYNDGTGIIRLVRKLNENPPRRNAVQRWPALLLTVLSENLDPAILQGLALETNKKAVAAVVVEMWKPRSVRVSKRPGNRGRAESSGRFAGVAQTLAVPSNYGCIWTVN